MRTKIVRTNIIKNYTHQDLKLLNCVLGKHTIRKCLGCSMRTVNNILGKSQLEFDTKSNISKHYNSELFFNIDYYVDGTRYKLKSLKAHDYQRLKNFPITLKIANRQGKLIYEKDNWDYTEIGKLYKDIIKEADIPKNCIIHVDLYDTHLFEQLEHLGYRVCYVPKRERIRLLKEHGKTQIPFLWQVEHLNKTIAKRLRLVHKIVNLKRLRQKQDILTLLNALRQVEYYNNMIYLLEWLKSHIEHREQIIECIS